MKRPDQDQLLRALLSGEEADDFREATLRQSVAFLRSRQRRRSLLRMGAVALLPVLLLAGLLERHPVPTRPAGVVSAPAPHSPPRVKIINDDELFALFPNRSMALIGTPGHQQLVFLDHGGASEQP